MEYLYRIKQKSTNMYSNGSISPLFTKHGKWYSLPDLNRHLKLKAAGKSMVDYYHGKYPCDWEVIKYKVEEVDV